MRRTALVMLALALLSGCGTAAPAAKPAPAATATTAKAPGAPPAFGPESATVEARHKLLLTSPKQITLAYNGLQTFFHVGDTFVLRLPAPSGWSWKLGSFDTSVLSRGAGPSGSQGSFRALAAGQAVLTATETPPCAGHCPDNAKGPVFTLTVIVSAAQH